MNDLASLNGTRKKLAPLWVGSFEITDIVSSRSVKLRGLMSQKDLDLMTDMHIDRSKKC